MDRVSDKEDGRVSYVELLLLLGVTIQPGDLEGVSTQIQHSSDKTEEKHHNDQDAK